MNLAAGDKLNTGKILVLALVLLAIVGAIFFYPYLNSKTIGINIYTNGTNTDVNAQNVVLTNVPQEMINQIKDKVIVDVQSDNSTVDSIKSDVKSIASNYNYTAEVKISSQYGNDQLPMLALVKGTSMVPTLQDGQSIIVLKTKDLKVGDIVVAVHPTYGLIVKRLSVIQGNQVYLTSDNKNVEIANEQTTLPNGATKTVTVKKTPLNTWLPIENVIGVVKVY